MNSKILILQLQKEHQWDSLRFHSEELIAEYRKTWPGKIKNLKLSNSPAQTKTILRNELKKNIFEKVIIIDPQIELASVVEAIGKLPLELVIHIYGDLPKQATRLSMALKKSSQLRIKYIVPCERFAKALALMTDSTAGIFIKRLHYQKPKKQIKKFDELLPAQSKQHIFGYSGRIEKNKNLSVLIEAFSDRSIYPRSLLIIAGEIDNRYFHYDDSTKKENIARDLVALIGNLDEQIRKRILFTGQLSLNENFRLMATADTMINLSTFYGEDFGFANCQSLEMKVPTISTDWAGFADHKKYFSHLKLVKVKVAKNGRPVIDMIQLKRAMKARITGELFKSVIKKNKLATLKSIIESRLYSTNKMKPLSEKSWNELMSGFSSRR